MLLKEICTLLLIFGCRQCSFAQEDKLNLLPAADLLHLEKIAAYVDTSSAFAQQLNWGYKIKAKQKKRYFFPSKITPETQFRPISFRPQFADSALKTGISSAAESRLFYCRVVRLDSMNYKLEVFPVSRPMLSTTAVYRPNFNFFYTVGDQQAILPQEYRLIEY